MTRAIHIPATLTEDDVWLIDQLIAKLAAIRAELARREAERGSELTEDSGL